MPYIYLGIYTIFVFICWGAFVLIRIHSLKFKDFSPSIPSVLRGIMILFIVLTLSGYILLFLNMGDSKNQVSVDISKNNILSEKSY